MNDIRAAIDNIIAVAEEQNRQPGEFTISEFVTRYNEKVQTQVNYGQAKRILDKQVTDGSLDRRKAIVNGKWCKVYKVADNEM